MSVVRNILKAASWLLTAVMRPVRPDVIVLMYHRVTGDVQLELDMPFNVFRAQMAHLASLGAVVSLDEAVAKLQKGKKFDRTLFVLTFDDAYEDFFTLAFPLLQELGLAVTLYVPTGFIENPDLLPISRQVANSDWLKPVTWGMLIELAASPLLTIGSHTHSHRVLPSLTDSEVLDEFNLSNLHLLEKLGQTMLHFSYPRGVWNERVENLAKNTYATVTLAGGGAIHVSDFVPHRIPRVPVLRSDHLFWFKSRLAGRLIYEDIFIATVKRFVHKFTDYGNAIFRKLG